MKSKILSLTLALMMIVSVAAALPVSAAPTKSINLDLSNLEAGNDGVNTDSTAKTVYTNNTYTAESIPEGEDWVDGYKPCGFWKEYESYGMMTINVPEAGYYDISVAYGSVVDAYIGLRTNSAIVQEKVEATGTNATSDEYKKTIKTVNVKDFSRKIYLDSGSQTVYVCVSPDAVASGDYSPNMPTYIYNILLSPSDNQTTVEDIIMAGDFNDKTASGGATYKSGRITPQNDAGWIPARLSYLATTAYDSTWTVYIPADGYYELSVAAGYYGNNLKANILYDTTTIASAFSLCTGSASSSDVKVVTTERFMAMKGLHTIKLDYTAGNDWLFGLKLSYSSNQEFEPVDVSFADCTSYSGGGSGTVFEGSNPPEDCAVEWATSKAKSLYPGLTSGFHTNVTMPKEGWYDVSIATSGLLDATAYVYGGGYFTYASVPATEGLATVAATDLGKIYLGKGTQGLNIEVKCGSGSWSGGANATYVYDLRLQYSDEQTAVEDIVLSANAPSQFGRGATVGAGERNRHTWPLDKGTNKCTWATNGATKVAGESYWFEYDVWVPEAGYYDLYTATCTLNDSANSLLSVSVGDTLYVEASAVTDSNNKALNTAAETHFGKVYLKEGLNTVRVDGDANSDGYYFFNLKLSPATPGEEDKINLLGKDNNVLEEDTVTEDVGFFAEICTSNDARLFVVNYTEAEDGAIKMENFTEATNVIKDGDIKVIRTPLFTAGSIVKVLLWEDGTFAPIDIAVPTVN